MTGKTPSLPDIDKLIRDLSAVGTFNSITQEVLKEQKETEANKKREAAKAAKEERLKNPQIGDIMPDGTIFAGISPTTGKPMYALPKDEWRRGFLKMSWDKAMKVAKNKKACGHKDYRLPDDEELNVLFNNRAAIGKFNGGFYWSTGYRGFGRHAHAQRFSDGAVLGWIKSHKGFSVRLVRG